MKSELQLSKNRSYDEVRHLVPSFLLMDDSANELRFVFGCDTPETAMGITKAGGGGLSTPIRMRRAPATMAFVHGTEKNMSVGRTNSRHS